MGRRIPPARYEAGRLSRTAAPPRCRGKFELHERGHALLGGVDPAPDQALGVAAAGAQLALHARARLLDVALELVARGVAAALEAADVLAQLALRAGAGAEAVGELAGDAEDAVARLERGAHVHERG